MLVDVLKYSLDVMSFPHNEFSDVLRANEQFIIGFRHSELNGTAKKGLAIVTCMDSRINPLAVVGLQAGDAKILRNAGARVTDDVLRTLVLASYLLGVCRVLVMPHTDCRMAETDEASLHATINERFGMDTSDLEFGTVSDQRSALCEDVIRIRSYPLLQKDVMVGGAIYDVLTGQLEPIEC